MKKYMLLWLIYCIINKQYSYFLSLKEEQKKVFFFKGEECDVFENILEGHTIKKVENLYSKPIIHQKEFLDFKLYFLVIIMFVAKTE